MPQVPTDTQPPPRQVIDSVARGGPSPPPSRPQFACATCDRLFSRVQNLRQHAAMHDASLERYACRHCDETFAWQQTRDRHIAKKHCGRVDKVKCPDCGRFFLPDSLRVSGRRDEWKIEPDYCQKSAKLY